MDDDAAARSLGSPASSTPRVEALSDPGGIAQTGERSPRKREVAGSTPAFSTIQPSGFTICLGDAHGDDRLRTRVHLDGELMGGVVAARAGERGFVLREGSESDGESWFAFHRGNVVIERYDGPFSTGGPDGVDYPARAEAH